MDLDDPPLRTAGGAGGGEGDGQEDEGEEDGDDGRRQSRDALAKEVRRHFQGMSVREEDVLVRAMYLARWQEREFRLRVGPFGAEDGGGGSSGGMGVKSPGKLRG